MRRRASSSRIADSRFQIADCRRLCAAIALLALTSGPVLAGEEQKPPPGPAPSPDVETRASEIYPVQVGETVNLFRDLMPGPIRILSVTIARKTLREERNQQLLTITAQVRNNGPRQVMPRLRFMLYRDGQYFGSAYIPPRNDPYQEVDPGRMRVMVGAVRVPLYLYPDAFRVDAMPEVLGVTSQEGVPAKEAAAGQKVWEMQIDRQVKAKCVERVQRGFLFEGENGARYIRLPNGETFVEGTVPPARLDPEALKQAKERARLQRR